MLFRSLFFELSKTAPALCVLCDFSSLLFPSLLSLVWCEKISDGIDFCSPLRVLGFSRRSIVVSFLIEGALLALLGGAAGCLAALPMHGYATGTLDFQSFSETVFEFTITPGLAFKGLVFSVIVGVLGSLLPALRASRIPVISALKSV